MTFRSKRSSARLPTRSRSARLLLRRSWTEKGRRYFHYEIDTPAVPFSPCRLLGEVRGARGSVGRRGAGGRSAHLPPSGASLRPGPDAPEHEGVARLLHHAVRPVLESPPSHRRDSALRNQLRHRSPAHDRRQGARLLQLAPGGRRSTSRSSGPHTRSRTSGGRCTARGACGTWPGLLSESLANYSAMMVTEKTYGPRGGRRVYDFQMERYSRGARVTVARRAAAPGRGSARTSPTARAPSRCTRCASTSARSASIRRCAATSRSTATRAAVPDVTRSVRRAPRRHARLAAAAAHRSVRDRHAVGRQDGAGARRADRRRRVPRDDRRRREEAEGRQHRQGDRDADGRRRRGRRLCPGAAKASARRST